jgi:hypothetical protein
VNESATHTLTSPTIAVPASALQPRMAFTHVIGAEAVYDGGTLELSINGGSFAPIPRTAIEFNPYNAALRTPGAGNTDPIAGREAWTGSGTRWGRTIVDLSALGVSGSSIQVRFVFGKDGCTGGAGWYIDDLSIYNCPDCDGNGVADIRQFRYRTSSPIVGPIGTEQNRDVILTGLPAAAGPVTLELLANADLSLGSEYIEISLNGAIAGRVFEVGGTDCPLTPSRGSLVVSAAVWNAARAAGSPAGSIDILLTGSADMDPGACTGSFVGANVRYEVAGASDGNSNLIPDACECPADFNHSGGLSVQDIFDFLAAYFSVNPAADFNRSGSISVQDIFDFLNGYFAGC